MGQRLSQRTFPSTGRTAVADGSSTKTAKRGERSEADLRNPVSRPLKVYAFDPSQGRALGNYMTVDLRYESLEPGPTGRYLQVIDYDASNKCYYRPVDLDDPAVLIRSGLDPTESDPQFHQQMVYAVASETIRRFEIALGRSISWSFSRWGRKDRTQPDRLRIFPHGMQEANAYYSRDLEALMFGYFFMEPTDRDAAAFHEAFADLVALFQHFSFKDALLQMIQQTGGMIYRTPVAPNQQPTTEGPQIQAELAATNPLVELARQFGDAMGMRKALRSALGTPPNSRLLDKLSEPHARGSILVAAVFDAFFTIYLKRTQDLIRIARSGGVDTKSNELHPDLASRLADAAVKTAEHFLNICIRALDYCAPIDIRFGDFLRAMITADSELVPDDPYGYRRALIDGFRSRGIVPDGAASYSEESLRWSPPEILSGKELPLCSGLRFDVFSDPAKRREARSTNAVILHDFAQANHEALGLSADGGIKIQARTFHEVFRVGPNGELLFDIVAELTQHRDVPVDPDHEEAGTFTFRGGTTIIVDQTGRVRYAISKPVGQARHDADNRRVQQQRAYQADRAADLGIAPYLGEAELAGRLAATRIDFKVTHRGY